MNSVNLIARLTADPERNTYGDTTVTKMRLAVQRVKDSQEADFIDVTVFGRQAEVCEQYLAKGRRIAVTGRLRQSQWKAEDGTSRQRLEVIGDQVEFLDGKPSEQPDPEAVAVA
jgi:single-strand DNA-binding protein